MFYEIPNKNTGTPILTQTKDNHSYAYIYVDLYIKVEIQPLVSKKDFDGFSLKMYEREKRLYWKFCGFFDMFSQFGVNLVKFFICCT